MRHHSTSIVGPDIDGEVTKEGMIAAMEDASKLVASWPEWKREVLREPDSAQPSMKEAMARVDARAEKIVAGIPLGQRAIVSKDELRPAQPSVGERLGEVARDEWLATGAVTRWDRIALAVRREVLKEVFAEEDVEAAAKALWNATLPGIAWDELREASRKPIRVQARAALAAADAVAKHKPLNMPADRSAMIEKALNANDGSCSTGMLAANGEAEYWALRSALATIAYENLGTIGLNDAEKVAAFKRLAADSISADAVGRERVVLYNGPACGFVTVIDDWMRRTFTEVGPRQITIEVRGEELFVRKVRGT